MKTDLKYILARNASNLKKFIAQNEIHTYEDLVKVCDERKFIPVPREEYDLLVAEGEQKKNNESSRKTVVKKQPAKTVVKKQPAKTRSTRSTRRRSSTSQKKQGSSSSSKKVKDS